MILTYIKDGGASYYFVYFSLPSYLADIILYVTIYVLKEGKYYRTTLIHKLYIFIAIIHLIITISILILARNKILMCDITDIFL